MARRKQTIEISDIQEATETKELVEEVVENKLKLKKQNLLSSGSMIMNLACTDTVGGAFLKGKYYLMVGASGSGKTWEGFTLFANSTLHKRFKTYRLIYDNVEDGANMDLDFYFGPKTAERIEVPEPERKDPITEIPQPYSKTAEQFYDTLTERLEEAEKDGTGIIYILDSMDALTTEAELKKASEDKKLRANGKDGKGSYGDGKAKINSQNIRRIVSRLPASGSILVIIAQERDMIGSMVGGKTYSGGTAMLFYATLQIWMKKFKEIKATIKGVEHVIGNLSKVILKKNRLTGQQHKEILLPIYHSFGIDDVGSAIDWLIANGQWEAGKSITSIVKATDFGVELKREELVRHIEDNNLEKDLQAIVQKTWNDIKTAIADKVQRKRRYV